MNPSLTPPVSSHPVPLTSTSVLQSLTTTQSVPQSVIDSTQATRPDPYFATPSTEHIWPGSPPYHVDGITSLDAKKEKDSVTSLRVNCYHLEGAPFSEISIHTANALGLTPRFSRIGDPATVTEVFKLTLKSQKSDLQVEIIAKSVANTTERVPHHIKSYVQRHGIDNSGYILLSDNDWKKLWVNDYRYSWAPVLIAQFFEGNMGNFATFTHRY